METSIYITLFVLFQLCLILQLYFLIGNQRRLAAYVPPAQYPDIVIPISVVISARNEAKNLIQYLPHILDQQYPDFEVVVVDDCSFDGTDMLLQDLEKQYPHLKVVTVVENYRNKTGKKFALTMGIKAAKHEHMLFTDADCMPASDHWIACMARNFDDKTQIVLGYSPYARARGLLNAFIRFETLKSGINYLSAALNGRAYMGVGRNLAYTKTLFFACKGFASHMHVLSGDDDLFVNQNATEENTKVEIDPESFTYSEAKSTLGSWFKQKTRHMGVGKLYRSSDKRMLTIDAVSGFYLYVLLILSIVYRHDFLLASGLCVLRLIIQIVLYSKVFKKLGAIPLLYFLPFFDILYYTYLNVFGLIGFFVKTKQWK